MTAIAILVAFLAGAIAGVLVLLRVGMASEERERPLFYAPATRSAAATRRVVGLYVTPPISAGQADHAADRTSAGQDLCPSTTATDR